MHSHKGRDAAAESSDSNYAALGRRIVCIRSHQLKGIGMIKRIIATLPLVTFAFTPVIASNTGSGYISAIHAMSNGVVMFSHAAGRDAVPSCVNASTSARWAINASTESGKVKLSVLLTAYGANKKIHIFGTGSCADWGDTETVDFFVIDG